MSADPTVVPAVETRDEWIAWMRDRATRLQQHQWELGDAWRNRPEKYGPGRELAAEIGVEYGTLSNLARVATKFPQFSRRRENLTIGHHIEVSALDDEKADELLDAAQADNLTIKQLRELVKAARITDTSTPPPLPDGKHHVIEADPPWAVPSGPKGPGHQYALMSTDAICDMALDVRALAADDCHLYLWATNTLLPDAFQVMEAWGFEYRTILTWVKPGIGLGHHFRTSTEHVLFGTRGKLDTLVNDQPTHFEMPAGRHSQKPKGFYDLIERCSPGPYVRLFARDQRKGWVSWGAEA